SHPTPVRAFASDPTLVRAVARPPHLRCRVLRFSLPPSPFSVVLPRGSEAVLAARGGEVCWRVAGGQADDECLRGGPIARRPLLAREGLTRSRSDLSVRHQPDAAHWAWAREWDGHSAASGSSRAAAFRGGAVRGSSSRQLELASVVQPRPARGGRRKGA